MKISRRGFVGTAAGATAGIVTSKAAIEGASKLTALTSVDRRAPSGPETLHAGVCGECGGSCGTRIRMIGERAVFVGGNPEHPINRGGLCPRGLASVQAHYHPDRLLSPRRRNGPDGGAADLTWETAIEELTVRLTALRESRQTHRVGIVHEATNDPLDLLIGRFLRGFGSPNDLHIHPLPAALRAAWRLTQGISGLGFDIERAGALITFGADVLDGWASPGFALRAIGRWRSSRGRRRGRFVAVGSRLSVTASRADEWVPIAPGREGVFALGLANVLITERRYDSDFIEQHVAGFEESTEDGQAQVGFRQWVLENYYPSRVAAETGVAAETVIRIARDLAENRPAIAIAGDAAALNLNGLWNCWAVHCLNAVLGSVGVEGGVLAPLGVPFAPGPAFESDDVAAAGLLQSPLWSAGPAFEPGGSDADVSATATEPSAVAALLAAADAGEPPLDVLLVVECDPVALSPAPERFIEVLQQIPLVVALSSQPNETTAVADLVLPTQSGLERWGLSASAPLVPHTVCALQQPVVPPRGDTRHPGEVLLELAARLPGATADALPWDDWTDYLRTTTEGIYAAQRGVLFGPEIEESWVRLMQGAGMWAPSYRSASQLWRQMQELGGWWDAESYAGEWRRTLRTPSGRFDLASRPERVDSSPAAAGSAADPEYPLRLYPFEVLAMAPGRFVDMPLLKTLSGPHFDGPMEGWVELHPHTAEELGLADGQHVRVESAAGAIEARLRIFEGLYPGVAAMPLGFGRTVGRWAAGWGANPLRLIDPHQDPTTGDLCIYETAVRVVPHSPAVERV